VIPSQRLDALSLVNYPALKGGACRYGTKVLNNKPQKDQGETNVTTEKSVLGSNPQKGAYIRHVRAYAFLPNLKAGISCAETR